MQAKFRDSRGGGTSLSSSVALHGWRTEFTPVGIDGTSLTWSHLLSHPSAHTTSPGPVSVPLITDHSWLFKHALLTHCLTWHPPTACFILSLLASSAFRALLQCHIHSGSFCGFRSECTLPPLGWALISLCSHRKDRQSNSFSGL